jgi:virginiamycin B lyase
VRVLMLALLMTAAASAAASAATITEFPTGNATPAPSGLIDGGDGNLWFVDTNALGRISANGTVKEFPISLPPGADLHAVVPGANGVMWFDVVDMAHDIGKLTPDGTITLFAPDGTNGLNMGALPNEMTTGPDGTVWFTDDGGGMAPIPAIGRITPAGVIKEFTYPNPMPQFESITPGNDGNIWVTDRGQHPAIAKVTPDGTITPFTIGAAPNQMPDGLTPGPDNKMWFTDEGTPAAIGTVPENGPATEPTTENTNTGMQIGSRPDAITAGADGRLWFIDQYSTNPQVGAVTPATAAVTEYPLGGVPQGIALGIDGNVWVTQHSLMPPAPEAVVRVKPDGTSTPFSDGLPATADLTEQDIVSGPDGNLWFVDGGTKEIGRAAVQLAPTATTGAASSIGSVTASVAGTVNARGAATKVSVQYGGSSVLGSTVSAGTLTASATASPVTAALASLPAGSTIFYRVVATNAFGTANGAIQTFKTAPATTTTNPSKTTTTTSTVGDHRIVLITPSSSACTAKSKSLPIKLSSSVIQGSKAAKVSFVSAALFVDRGVKHIRHKTKRSHGKKIRVKVTVFTANKVVRKLPAQPSLRLSGLPSGQHTLNVRLLFEKGKKGSKTPVRKAIHVHFRVC